MFVSTPNFSGLYPAPILEYISYTGTTLQRVFHLSFILLDKAACLTLEPLELRRLQINLTYH